MTRTTIDRLHSLASVTRMIFPCRYHFHDDNKQEYNHAIKLPDGRSGEIRFPAV